MAPFKNIQRRGKIIKMLQAELDSKGKEEIAQNEPTHDIAESLKRLHDTVTETVKEHAGEFKARTKKKKIVLKTEIVPYQHAVRAMPISEEARPWRHDGGSVQFRIIHSSDRLELYSTRGEFVAGYPVESDGTVTITGLEKGVYLLYLKGRKISELTFDDGK
jgi:hypothetical protein